MIFCKRFQMNKICIKCLKEKEIELFSFRKDINKYRNSCISCDNERKSKWKKENRKNCNLSQQTYRHKKQQIKIIKEHGSIEAYNDKLRIIEDERKKEIISNMLMLFLQSKNLKRCIKCEDIKNIDNFPKTKHGSYRSTCKECNAKKTREWVSDNKELKKEMDKKYYHENINKVKKYKQDWTKEHFSKEENKTKKLKLSQEHRSKNVELYRAYTIKRRELRNKINDANLIDTSKVISAFCGKCFKCGKDTKLSIDHHMPLSKGFKLTYSNAVLLCSSCNSSKSNKHPKEFYSNIELMELENMGINTYDNY